MHIKRKRYGDHQLIHEGRDVGRVHKYPSNPGFGIYMPDIYWRRGEPTRQGGSSGTSCKRLKDAVGIAESAIPLLPPNYK